MLIRVINDNPCYNIDIRRGRGEENSICSIRMKRLRKERNRRDQFQLG